MGGKKEEVDKRKLTNCPQCGRHCPVEKLHCKRGKAYFAEVLEEREAMKGKPSQEEAEQLQELQGMKKTEKVEKRKEKKHLKQMDKQWDRKNSHGEEKLSTGKTEQLFRKLLHRLKKAQHHGKCLEDTLSVLSREEQETLTSLLKKWSKGLKSQEEDGRAL